MFYNCINLMGGNGYKYNNSQATDKTYAKFDVYGSNGYFTHSGSAALIYNMGEHADCDVDHNAEYLNYTQSVPSGYSYSVQGATPLENPVCTDVSGMVFKCWYLDGDETKTEYVAGMELESTGSPQRLIAQ